MYGDLTVVQRFKFARLRWADHVVRMETDDPARRVFLGRPQGQRRRGRPKLRWQDGARDNGLTDEGARPRAVSDTSEAGQDRKAVVAPDR